MEENIHLKIFIMGLIACSRGHLVAVPHTPEYGDGFRTLSVFRTQSTDGNTTEYGRNLKTWYGNSTETESSGKFGYGYGYGYGQRKKMKVRVRNFDGK